MIKIEDSTKCCGCSACAAACPHSCINILSDKEGFYYPQVDEAQCVDCGVCTAICPVINNKPEIKQDQICCVVQNKNLDILKDSTSGGAFTSFAEYIIKQHGIVVGAAFNEDFLVEHVIVDSIEGLIKFRNSKYVQSYISPTIYKKIKESLESGRPVCFSGTLCQVEGLRAFLGDYNPRHLLCVDVVCRAVPSPLIFKKYLEYQTYKNKAEVKEIKFRDKKFGYSFPTVCVNYKGRKNYNRGLESDPWLRAFMSGICNRPSCYECVFKKRYRSSDLTLWDCFDYNSKFGNMLPNLGATNVLIQSSKGEQVFKMVASSLIYETVETDKQLSRIKEMTNSTPCDNRRKRFFKDALSLNGLELFNKYFPIGFKYNLLFYGRRLAMKLGIYDYIRTAYKGKR